MKVKREYKSNTVIVVLVLLIVFYFGLRLGTLVELNDGEWSFEVLNQASDQFFSFEPLIFNQFTLMIGSFLALFSWMIYETLHSSYKKNMQEEAFGSAKWNDPNFTKDMREKDMYQNWIFTKTEIFSKNMKVTKRNRNCTLIGRPGTGKSRYYIG